MAGHELECGFGCFEPFGPVKNDSSLAERRDHEAVPVREYFVIAAWRAPLTACAEKHRTAARKLNLFSNGQIRGRRKPIQDIAVLEISFARDAVNAFEEKAIRTQQAIDFFIVPQVESAFLVSTLGVEAASECTGRERH